MIERGDRIIVDGEAATVEHFDRWADMMDYVTDAGAHHWLHVTAGSKHRWCGLRTSLPVVQA